jgi:phenylalanine-4-hydroxylase
MLDPTAVGRSHATPKPRSRRPRAHSVSADWRLGPDVAPPTYSPAQHYVWRKLNQIQRELAPCLVCPEYLRARERLAIDETRVPELRALDCRLRQLSGWGIIKVPGYVPSRPFFRLLEQKLFPCTDQLRHASELEYARSPDMWHDVMGHLPMLVEPAFGEFNHLFGRVGSRIRHEAHLNTLEKIYWFSMEFGIVHPPTLSGDTGDISCARLYGATLVSSAHEMTTSLTDAVERRPFSIEAVSQMKTDVSRVNEVLFEISSFDALLQQLIDWATDEHLL